jgi:exonuclease SbcC
MRQELSPEHRKATLKQLESEGKEKGDRFRANQAEGGELVQQIKDYEVQIAELASAENERVRYASEISQLTERLDTLQTLSKDWESTGKKRLKAVERILETGKYAAEEHKRLAKLDKELEKLGYDVSAHERARETEFELRAVEEEHLNLKSAKEVSKQIASEIANLKSELKNREAEIKKLEEDHRTAQVNLEAAEAGAPDLDEAERELFRHRETETRPAASWSITTSGCPESATRRAAFERNARNWGKRLHATKRSNALCLGTASALLIEQALPQIEDKANELLDRLSDGHMSVRFVTQTEYKDKKRDDLKETLEIQISDTAGIRNYEMYSGGEAFRVNFAIRLALSKILAQRKGARLQTLVVDEGFGSQDTQGRQRLIEAINLVKHDFAKILVITHLDELKDAFPTRIEVEKTDRGSTLRVI